MVLWLIFAALTALVAAVLLRPLLRADRASAGAPEPAAHDAALYADQLAEVDSDLARGVIAPAEAEAARVEIARRLLRSTTAVAPSRAAPAHGVTKLAAGLAFLAVLLCLPVLGVVLYLAYGSPGLPDQPLRARLEAPPEGQQIAALIARVEARLRENPQDGRGWDVIAPVYLRLERYEEAADAFARARRLLGDSSARLAGYGEALVLANNGVVTDAAKEAFEKALTLEPTLVKPRFWLAMAAEQDGRFADAATRWRTMLSEAPADAPWRGLVEERLRLAEGRLDQADRATSPGAVQSERGPSAADIAAAENMTAQERAAMINQMVAGLAERLARDGNDLEGWKRLVRAYMVLGRRDDAVQALGAARRSFAGDGEAAAQLDALASSLGL